MLNGAILTLGVILTVLAQLLLKRGVQTLGDIPASAEGILYIFIQVFKNIYLFGGLFFLGVSFLLWILLVSKMQLNVLYPITVSAQLALLAAGSWLWFSEALTLYQLFGILVVIGGIFLLSSTA